MQFTTADDIGQFARNPNAEVVRIATSNGLVARHLCSTLAVQMAVAGDLFWPNISYLIDTKGCPVHN